MVVEMEIAVHPNEADRFRWEMIVISILIKMASR